MEAFLQLLAIYACAAAVICSPVLKSRYRRDVYKRLEETRTHKQMRELERQINSEKRARKITERLKNGPQYDARLHLNDGELPQSLTAVRRAVPLADICGLAVLAVALHRDSTPLLWTSLAISTAVAAAFAVYHITERRHAERCLPKMSKHNEKSPFFPWNGKNQRTGRSYSAREKKIVIRAFFLRYPPLLPIEMILLATRERLPLLIAGAMIFAEGAAFHWHYTQRSEAFLCAMQSFAHAPMTPLHHSHGHIKYAEKQGKWLGVLEMAIGAVTFLLAALM